MVYNFTPPLVHSWTSFGFTSLLCAYEEKRLSVVSANTGLFISPSGISELDCATTKTDTAKGAYQ